MKSKAKTSTVDARSKFGALVASGALKASERHVAGAYDAEDRIAEGLAMTWVWFEKQVALGREPELRLTRHCCRMRTIDRRHRLDSGDRRRWAQDVYHQAGRNGVELRRLQFLEHEDDRVRRTTPSASPRPGAPTRPRSSTAAWICAITAITNTLDTRAYLG